jgi:hypothetical protein
MPARTGARHGRLNRCPPDPAPATGHPDAEPAPAPTDPYFDAFTTALTIA